MRAFVTLCVFVCIGTIAPLHRVSADVDFSFLQATANTADNSVYTFSSENFGAADADRCIIVAINARKSGATTNISSVTIGGETATIIAQQSQTVTNTNVTGIASAIVPTGTTGNVVVTFGATMVRAHIGVYRAVGLESCTTAHDTGTSVAGDPTTGLDIEDGGIAIGTGKVGASTAAAWTGLTENYDTVVESFSTVTGASGEFATGETNRTVTINFTTETESVGAFASWSPAAGEGSASAFSGTLFTDAGVTAAPGGVTIGLVIGTSTPSVHTTTTASNGTWQFSNIATSSISSTTPIALYISGSSTDATTLVSGFGGSSINSIPIWYNRVLAYGSSTDTVINPTNFTLYDRDQNSDLLFVTATSATSTTFFANFSNQRGILTIPQNKTLVLQGTYSNNATFSNSGTLVLGSAFGEVIGTVTGTSALGSVRVTGDYSFPTNASTTDFVIERGGVVTAPSGTLTVRGSYSNSGSFDHSGGTIHVDSIEGEIVNYLNGQDVTSGAGSILIYALISTSSTLYVAKAGNSGTCSSTDRTGCELMVFDISSTTNPVYVSGQETTTGVGNLTLYSLIVIGTKLYVGKVGSSGVCSRTERSGCELMVFDISSTTNPIYMGGQDIAPGTENTFVYNFTSSANGTTLYAGKTGNSGTCSSTDRIGCELMVFDPGIVSGGVISGLLTSANALHDVRTNGQVIFGNNAETTGDLLVQGGTTTLPQLITVSGAFANSAGVYAVNTEAFTLLGDYENNGTILYGLDTRLVVSGSTQTLSGTLNGVSALPNTTVSGGGTKNFSSSAATRDLTIITGTTLGASADISIRGSYTNNGTFTNNNGEASIEAYIVKYLNGSDSGTGTGNEAFRVVTATGSVLYVGKDGNSGTCSSTDRIGCELMVFDISSTTNPVYVNGQDSTTGAGTNRVDSLAVTGNTLYVGKFTNTGTCSRTDRTGCELMVFDISSTTNPVYVNGQDSAGTSDSIEELYVHNNVLYLAKVGNTGTCSVADRTGCELLVFDISSTTNPVYVNGQDTGGFFGSDTALSIFGSTLYIGKAGNSGTCSSTIRTGCELQVFDISSTTNPVYVNGQDSTTGTGSNDFRALTTSGSTLYIGKALNTGTCSSTDRIGCELMVFDISSTTDPVYVNGRDITVNVNRFGSFGSTLYVSKAGTAGTCSDFDNGGCELQVFDISSTTDPVQVNVQDSGGAESFASFYISSTTLYVGKGGNTGTCSSVERRGCELQVYAMISDFTGTMVGSSNLGNLSVAGSVRFQNNASTTNLTNTGLLIAPSVLTASGTVTQNGVFNANGGEVILTNQGGIQDFISTGTTTFHALTKRATASSTLRISGGATMVSVATTTLRGSAGNLLTLLSAASGTPWYLNAATTSVSYLRVQDSFNQAADTIFCSTGCIDAGGNTNWNFIEVIINFLLSGTLFSDQGTTPAPAGITLGITIGTSSPSVYTVTTESGGTWSLSSVATTSIASTTPIIVFIDATSTDATTLVSGYNNATITSIPVWYNTVLSYGSSTDTIVDLSAFSVYDRDQDSDILFVTATSATSTTFFADFNNQRGVFTIPTNANAVFTGNYTNNASLDNDGTLTLAGTGAIAGSVTGANQLGTVRVTGSYTTPANASTTSLVIESSGSLTAPSNILTVTNTFSNSGTFTNNSGVVVAEGIEGDVLAYRWGDDPVSTAGGIRALHIVGNILYAGTEDFNQESCVSDTGESCELLIFDISSTTNNVLLGGREAGSGAFGRSITSITVASTTLYVGQSSSYSACDSITGEGCELLVFDIASTTNPVFLKGLETGFDIEGGLVNVLSVVGSVLYAGVVDEMFDTCVTSTGQYCELLIYDISSTTNPTLLGGREIGVGFEGVNALSFSITSSTLFVGRQSYTGVCDTETGQYCELYIFNIASTTNPIFLGGRESSVSPDNDGNVLSQIIKDTILYIGRDSNGGVCDTETGDECELLVFDIASTTNPVLIGGKESDISFYGGPVMSLALSGSVLYASREATYEDCIATTGAGCEILAYDISDPTRPVFVGGKKIGFAGTDVTDPGDVFALATVETTLFVGRSESVDVCDVASGYYCKVLAFDGGRLPAVLFGSFAEDSALNDLVTKGRVLVASNASTSAMLVESGTTTVAANSLSVSNGLTNDGVLDLEALDELTFSGGSYENNGETSFNEESLLRFTGTTQNLSGLLSDRSSLPSLHFLGSGTKTFLDDALVESITIDDDVTVLATENLVIGGDFTNGGVFTPGGLVEGVAYINRLLAAQEGGSSEVYVVVASGTVLYVASSGSSATCSSTDRTGCELKVFDISSTTNPVYVNGQDSGTGFGTQAINALVISGNVLYAGRAGSTGTCSSTDRTGCELMVFDISSTTNPTYVNGQQGAGVNDTFFGNIRTMVASGTSLYVGKSSNSGTCSSTDRTGCELMVFDISSTTNPTYVNGRDSGGNNISNIVINGSVLYVAKSGNNGTCSSTVLTGCELMVFDISSTTNPTYVNGQQGGAAGDFANAGIDILLPVDSILYAGKSANSGTCSSTVLNGCELMVFDISSTTNPTYVNGLDSEGRAVYELISIGPALYVGYDSASGACNRFRSGGCDVVVFDISSTTNPLYADGVRVSGGADFSPIAYSLFFTDTALYLGKNSSSEPCTITYSFGCEIHVFDISSNFSGNLTGSSALGNVTVSGNARFLDNASTTNLFNDGFMHAPGALSVSGSFTQSGLFDAQGGEVILNGVSQQTATGSLNTLHNLTIRNTSGTGSTSQSVIFGAPIQTTGTFTMVASTSAQFPAGSTSTVNRLVLAGTNGSPVYLRSSTNDTQYRLLVNEDVATSSSYVNVKDAWNVSTSSIDCTTGCFDAGNNINWFFGSSSVPITLAESDAGQVDNLFSFMNKTDEPFYTFKLIPDTEAATITDLTLTLTGIRNIDNEKLIDLALYRDHDSDGELDVTDTLIGGPGILSIDGQTGTVTFATDFAATTTQNYLVTASTRAIPSSGYLTVRLFASGVDGLGQTSGAPLAVAGDVSAIQHIRGDRGGGSARSPVGGDGPPGNSLETGGGESGGGEVGQEDDGENIASDPNFRAPSTNGDVYNEWTNPQNAYDSDGTYATAASAGLRQTYGGFGFAIPGGNSIQGIVVKIDASGSTAAGTLEIGLSSDGGTTITTTKATPTLIGTDLVYEVGGLSDLWGRSWTPSDFSDTNFRLRVIAQPSSNTIRLDALEVRVYHTAGGGGAGGGGGGI